MMQHTKQTSTGKSNHEQANMSSRQAESSIVQRFALHRYIDLVRECASHGEFIPPSSVYEMITGTPTRIPIYLGRYNQRHGVSVSVR